MKKLVTVSLITLMIAVGCQPLKAGISAAIAKTQSERIDATTQSAQAIPSTPIVSPTLAPTLTGTSVHMCCAPEPQHPQVDACAEAGGGDHTLLKNYGTWQGFYAFKCVCRGSSLNLRQQLGM